MTLVLAAAGIQFHSPLIVDMHKYLMTLGLLYLSDTLGLKSSLKSFLSDDAQIRVKYESLAGLKAEQPAQD